MRARPRKKKLLTRRHFLAAAGAAGAAMVACGVESVLIEPTWTHVSRLSIELPRLPRQWDGVKIAHLTDLHVGRFVSLDYARQVVALTNRQGPDIIVVTGDLVSRSEAIKPGLREALAGLSAPEGVYACVGNHDWWHGLAATLSLLRRAGITVLLNGHVPLQRRGAEICLAGVDDFLAGSPDLADATDGVDAATFKLLLAHNPDYAEAMPTAPQVDLMLCGHTHGGQICLPFLGPLALPIRHRKYASGLVVGPNCPVYISRGIGVIGIPARFNCRPELAMLTLRSA